MATPMTAAETLAAMKLWHVPVREYAGWKTRGRDPEHGPFGPVNGIVIHHSGSDAQSDNYLKFLAVDGRGDLPAPLCNVSTDMDGDLWLIAQGRANHAGSGSSGVLSRVVNEDYAGFVTELKAGPDNTDGNAHFYGNEVRYDGGQPMSAKQYASATRWAAAVCHHHGWSAMAVIAHREWTTRKPDPGKCPMTKFRADVAALLKAGPPKATKPPAGDTPNPPKEIDMQLTDADKKWITGEVQRFSAFGAKHTDQVEATTDDDVDLILKDDFAKLGVGIQLLINGQTEQTAAINRLAAAIEAGAPKA